MIVKAYFKFRLPSSYTIDNRVQSFLGFRTRSTIFATRTSMKRQNMFSNNTNIRSVKNLYNIFLEYGSWSFVFNIIVELNFSTVIGLHVLSANPLTLPKCILMPAITNRLPVHNPGIMKSIMNCTIQSIFLFCCWKLNTMYFKNITLF